jgi:hypothetical protein
MRANTVFICFVVLALQALGCGGSSGPGPCPTTTVVLDAGVEGLPDAGECYVGKPCEPFCGWQPVCCRVEELVLECRGGCK